MTRLRKSLFSLLALPLLLSCDDSQNKVFDNPLDQEGVNYSPPSLVMQTPTREAPTHRTVSLDVIGRGSGRGDTVMMAYFHNLELNRFDSVGFKPGDSVATDTFTMTTGLNTPKVIKVAVMVRNSRGVFSTTADTFRLAMRTILPTLQVVKADTMVDLWDTASVVARGQDSGGTIAKYHWTVDGVESTTADSVIRLPVGHSIRTVTVIAENDVGLRSASKLVRLASQGHPPQVTSLSVPDTAEFSMPFTVKAKASDAGGSVAKLAWRLFQGTDTAFKAESVDSVLTIPGNVVAAIKAGRWTLRAIATDNDTLTASADTSLVIAARGPVLVPAARKILRVGVLDTFSLQFAANERIDSAARAPITIKVKRDTSPVYSLANMAWLKDSLTKAGTVYYRYWAEDNLHLRSATDTIQVVASDRMPTLTSPAKGQQASDTAVLFTWTPGYYDSFFVLIADTVADKILTNNGADAMIRRRVDSSSLRVVFPFNTRIHWRVLGFARGRSDSASSESFSFNTPPDAQSDPNLSALDVAGRSLMPGYSVQDSVYTVNIDPSVTSLNLTFTRKTGQSIEVSSEAVAATVLSSSPYTWNITAAGLNDTLKLKVTSANGKIQRTIRIGIKSVIDLNYLLDSLHVNGVPLAGFSTMGGTFQVPFETGTTSVEIKAFPHSFTAIVTPGRNVTMNATDTAKTLYVNVTGQPYTIKYRLVPVAVKSKSTSLGDLYLSSNSAAFIPWTVMDANNYCNFEGAGCEVNVSSNDSLIKFMYAKKVPVQTLLVNGAAVSAPSGFVNLRPEYGRTEVKLKVIAEDTNYTWAASIFINRSRSIEARLATLTDTASLDTLGPTFSPDVYSYAVSAPFGADSVRLAFSTKTSGTTVRATGGILAGNLLTIPLKAYRDTAKATITILAADTTVSKTYSIAARTRAPNQVAVLAGLNYALSTATGMSPWTLTTDSVLKVTASFKDTGFAFTATRQGGLATLSVNGIKITSGVKTAYLPLLSGDTTTFKLVVTAQDTAVKKNYHLKVFRPVPSKAAGLSDLVLTNGTSALGLDTTFKPSDTAYVTTAAYADTAVIVTPTGLYATISSITVNGTVVASGSASNKIALLKAGDTNLVSIVVTAQDTAVKRTYTVKVFRIGPSKVADLYGLTLQNGPYGVSMDTAFRAADTVYVASVPFLDTAVYVVPSTNDATIRKITVNGTVVSSGTISPKIPLLKVADTNMVSIEVTAQDSTVKKTYLMKVFRGAPSKVADLYGLSLMKGASGVALDTGFRTSDTVYATSVQYVDSAVTVIPTTNDATIRKITVNGVAVSSGVESGKVLLPKVADTNLVSIVVTAQDSAVKQTYVVKVFREAPNKNAWLKRIGASAGTLSPVFDTSKTAYTLNVDNSVTAVTFAPMALDSIYGTVTVTGAPTGLVVGTAQVATLTVKAQDTTVKKVYTVSVVRSRGDSLLPASFSTDTTLTLANSPYLVGAASFTVPLGKTLRIEPGVRIKVPVTTVGGTAVPKAFLVKGSLLARGTVAQPIVFTKASVTNWGYLLIDSTSDDANFDMGGAYANGTILENVVVEYAGASPGAPGGLRVSAASPYLRNVTVQGSSTVGVQLVNSDNQTMQADGVVLQDNGSDGWNGANFDWNDGSKFTNCVAQRNGGIGFANVGTAVTMAHCSALQNGSHGFHYIRGGKSVGLVAQGNTGYGMWDVSGLVDSCHILSNQGGGMRDYNWNSAVILTNSEIRGNSGEQALGITVSSAIGSYSRGEVANTVIAGNNATYTAYFNGALAGSSFRDNVIQDNVASSTDRASHIFGAVDHTTTSNAFVMKNNIFRNNRAVRHVLRTTDYYSQMGQFVQNNLFVGNQATNGAVFQIGSGWQAASFDGNRIDSNVALTGQVIEVGGYDVNQFNFTNNAVRANRVSTGVTGSVIKINGYSNVGGKVVFAGNNFVGHKWDGVNWFLMQMEHPATGIGATATGNYWGQADSDPNMFLDATLDPSRAAIDYTGALSVPSPTAPALP